jgi:hypothetical protein
MSTPPQTQALGELAAAGGSVFWVAPSGGRDRPDPETGEFVVAPFDSKVLDMFKIIAMQSQKVRLAAVRLCTAWVSHAKRPVCSVRGCYCCVSMSCTGCVAAYPPTVAPLRASVFVLNATFCSCPLPCSRFTSSPWPCTPTSSSRPRPR